MSDPLRGSDLPAVSPTAPPAGPLLDGKHTAHDGDSVEPSADTAGPVLAVEAQKLAEEVMGLRESADKLARRASRNEWALALTAIGLALDIALSIFAFILLSNQSTSNTRLEASIHEQCSLYSLILPSYSSAAQQRSPLGPKAYDDAFRRIQVSSDHLGCGITHVI